MMDTVHIADLHIGAVPPQYIIEALRKLPAGPPVFILGDVFHHKTRYTPADLAAFTEMAGALAGRTVVITPGNHDCLAATPDLPDCLSPLVAEQLPLVDYGDRVGPVAAPRHPTIQYWRRSGEYELDGRQYIHISPWCVLTTAEIAAKVKPTTTLLYHGPVEGQAWTHSPLITLEVLGRAWRTFLGDIHRWNLPTANSAYPGSLVQQNLGEEHAHGYIEWRGAVPQFVDLAQPPLFVTVDLVGKTAEEVAVQLAGPAVTALKTRVRADDASSGLICQVAAKYGRVDVVATAPNYEKISFDVVRGHIRDALGPDVPEEVAAKMIAEFMAVAVEQRHGTWWPLRMEWSNYGRYGRGNTMEFTPGLTGLVAANCAGKSTLFEVFALAMFNHGRRNVRHGEASAECRVWFSVEGVEWQIHRVDWPTRHAVALGLASEVVKAGGPASREVYSRLAGLVGDWRSHSHVFTDELAGMSPWARLEAIGVMFGLRESAQLLQQTQSEHRAAKAAITALVRPRISAVADLGALRAEEAAAADEIAALSAKMADVAAAVAAMGAVVTVPAEPAPMAVISAEELANYAMLAAVVVGGGPVSVSPAWRDPHPLMTEAAATRQLDAAKCVVGRQKSGEVDTGGDMTALLAKLTSPSAQAKTGALAAVNTQLTNYVSRMVYADGCQACAGNMGVVDAERARLVALRGQLEEECAVLAAHRLQCAAELRSAAAWAEEGAAGALEWYSSARGELGRLRALKVAAAKYEDWRRWCEAGKAVELAGKKAAVQAQLEAAWAKRADLAARIRGAAAENAVLEEYNRIYPAMALEERRLRAYSTVLKSGSFRQAFVQGGLNALAGAANALVGLCADWRLECTADTEGMAVTCVDGGHRYDLSLGSGYQRCLGSLALRLAIATTYPCGGRFLFMDDIGGAIDPANIGGVGAMLKAAAAGLHSCICVSHHPDLMGVYDRTVGIIDGKMGAMPVVATVATAPTTFDPAKYQCRCGKAVKNTLSAITAHNKTQWHISHVKTTETGGPIVK